MKPIIFPVLLLIITTGCSSEMAKRTTYETLENVRINECQSVPSSDCPERESYDSYTRKRNEVVKE